MRMFQIIFLSLIVIPSSGITGVEKEVNELLQAYFSFEPASLKTLTAIKNKSYYCTKYFKETLGEDSWFIDDQVDHAHFRRVGIFDYEWRAHFDVTKQNWPKYFGELEEDNYLIFNEENGLHQVAQGVNGFTLVTFRLSNDGKYLIGVGHSGSERSGREWTFFQTVNDAQAIENLLALIKCELSN